MQRNIKTSKRPIPIWLSWDKYLKKSAKPMEWPFLFTLHSYEHVPALNQFQIKQKTDWLLLQNTRSGVLHLHPHVSLIPFNPGEAQVDLCARKHVLKHFMAGSWKTSPCKLTKHYFFFNSNKLQVIHRFKT